MNIRNFITLAAISMVCVMATDKSFANSCRIVKGTLVGTVPNPTRAKLLHELEIRNLDPYFKPLFSNEIIHINDYMPNLPLIAIYKCETPENKNIVCAHYKKGGGSNYTSVERCMKEPLKDTPPPPPVMCQVNKPATMNCDRSDSNFADFTNGCTYQAARVEYEPC